MSIRHMQQVFGLGPEVSGSRRMVLIVLADMADEDGYTYPKKATIAARAGIKRIETVREVLAWLEGQGYVVRDVNGWEGMRRQIPADRRPNLYQLTIDGCTDNGYPDSGEGGYPDSGEPRVPEKRVPESPLRNPHEEPTLPNPPEGRDNGQLFAVAPSPPSERKRARDKVDPWLEASFAQWWGRYRAMAQTPHLGGVGSRAGALRAYAKVVGDLTSSTEVDRQLANYAAARALFTTATKGEPCALMAAPRFLKEGRHDFDHELSEAEVLGRWPSHGVASSGRSRPPEAPDIVKADRRLYAMWLRTSSAEKREDLIARAQDRARAQLVEGVA